MRISGTLTAHYVTRSQRYDPRKKQKPIYIVMIVVFKGLRVDTQPTKAYARK